MSAATIRSFTLKGPAGNLEALLNLGTSSASHAALVAHPHPMFGGTLHNKVVFHTMKALNSFGWPVLRFNFRGTGLSQGEHDYGRGEVDDVRAAIDWLDQEFHLPLIFAGFSFGSVVGLQAACPDERVRALIGLGLPVGQPEMPAALKQAFAKIAEACARHGVLAAGHFALPHLAELQGLGFRMFTVGSDRRYIAVGAAGDQRNARAALDGASDR